jgi:hypothetical protein
MPAPLYSTYTCLYVHTHIYITLHYVRLEVSVSNNIPKLGNRLDMCLCVCTEDRQNNRNNRHYRNKTVSAALRKIICFFLYYFVCLLCVVPVSLDCTLRLLTVRMKVLQNGRLFRLLKRSEVWCALSWSICNKHGLFIKCIHSSSFQSYDDIHKSWGDTNKRKSGRKPKQSERDRRTLNKIVSKQS